MPWSPWSLVIAGYAVWQVARLGFGIQRSDILGARPPEEMNILLMGLDSRLDMNGKPLSPELYEALQAGDATDGGLNANVLMYVHIPPMARARSFLHPRDDYVDLAGCPDGVQGKDQDRLRPGLRPGENRRLVTRPVCRRRIVTKQSRDAARKAQIATVEKFLDVSIDHFVEVTMVAFFEIAQVVQPITVCVKEDTVDTYRGRLQGGEQQISAQQAVSFVRQRRDTCPTQAALHRPRSLPPPAGLHRLAAHPAQAELDPHEPGEDQRDRRRCPAQHGDRQRPRPDHAGQDREHPPGWQPQLLHPAGGQFFDNVDGQDVNVVDLAAIRATVKEQLNPPIPTFRRAGSPTPTPSINGAGITLDVVNASGRDGAAKAVLDGLAAKGFTRGKASTGTANRGVVAGVCRRRRRPRQGARDHLGGVTPREDTSLSAGTMVLTIGSGWTAPSGLGPTAAPASSPAPSGSAAAPVDATGGGVPGPPPTALTELQGLGDPCVK